MTYRYTAYTADKKIVQGTIDGNNETVAEDALYRAGYRNILNLTKVSPGISLEQQFPFLFGVRTQEVIDFSRELATLIRSGITILTGLQLLKEQASRAPFRKVITGLINDLQGGSSFSIAVSNHPQAFSYTYCQVVKASEQSGNLDDGLSRIADYMDKMATIRKRMTRALSYPALVLVLAIAVVILLITLVLPPLIDMFGSFGVDLPWATKVVIIVGTFLINYQLYLLLAFIVVVILISTYVRLPSGKENIDMMLLKLPIISPLVLQRNMNYFCVTTAMLLKAGLLMPQIMNIAADGIKNSHISKALREVRNKLIQGQGLSEPMSENGLFPRLLVEMVTVGEKTGDLESTLFTMADYYEQKFDQRMTTLIAMIEPTMTLAVGLVVAVVALSLIAPLYTLIGSMQ